MGRLPAPFGSMTNQQRAQVLYGQDERLRKMHDLLDMAELAKKSGAGPAGVDLKKEVQQTFMRKPWE